MALEANFEISQGADCSACTLTDITTGYDTENIPAQRTQYQEITPAATSGKTRIPMIFTSGATIVALNVTILSGDTVAQKVAKMVTAINGNSTIAAIVTATDSTTKCTVTADAEDVEFSFESAVDEPTDLLVTVANFPFSTRTITILYPDGTSDEFNFPYVDGYGDEYAISGLTKDYCLDITMTITPQVVVVGSDYSFENVIVLSCNADACYNTLASDLQININDKACVGKLNGQMTKINNYLKASHDKANVLGGQVNAQFFLDQITQVCDGNCGC